MNSNCQIIYNFSKNGNFFLLIIYSLYIILNNIIIEPLNAWNYCDNLFSDHCFLRSGQPGLKYIYAHTYLNTTYLYNSHRESSFFRQLLPYMSRRFRRLRESRFQDFQLFRFYRSSGAPSLRAPISIVRWLVFRLRVSRFCISIKWPLPGKQGILNATMWNSLK